MSLEPTAQSGPLLSSGNRLHGRAAALREHARAPRPSIIVQGDPANRGRSSAVEPRATRASGSSRVDGLAIGAPATAAFVGVMLAKSELVGAGAAGSEDPVTAASAQGPHQPGAGQASSGGFAVIAAQAQLEVEHGGTEARAVDPVSVPSEQAGTRQDASGAPGGAQSIPGASTQAPPVEGGDWSAAGAITFNLSTAAFGLEGVLAGDELAGDDLAPIGAFVAGAADDDVLEGTDRSDHLEGGAGDDLILGLGGDDWLDGGSGDDSLFGGDGADFLLGGSGQDQLDGGADDDLLLGGDGDDTLLGGSGNDQLDGGAGNDALDGGTGIDRLFGGTGDDTLTIDNAHDLALEKAEGIGGGGRDVLQVAEGFGGSAVTFVLGDDLGATAAGTASAHQQVDSDIEDLVLTGTVGHDAIGDSRDNNLIGNAGDNALYGAAGDDFLQGGDGADLLDGGFGADRLEGGAGNDILAGGDDADLLYGGDGNDQLEGGLGADQLYGQAGDDSYLIGLNDSAIDTVFDHEGSNQIVLQGVAGRTVEASIVDGDLYLVVDDNPVAVVSDYVGHEDSIAGIDLGDGIVAVADLLRDGTATTTLDDLVEPELDLAPSEDLLASYLSQPSLVGADTADQLIGTSGSDWLHGLAGDDDLQGADGSDVLEGGAGNDLLQGGAGDDRYLFRSGDSGLDTIRDAEGSNVAELDGFTGARLEGVVVGHDLIVVADYAPIFKVENYVGNEASFAGVQVDDTFVSSDELFG